MIFAAQQPWWVFDLNFWSVVAFVILVSGLFALLRKPLASAMKDRERAIVSELRQADIAAAELKKIREEFEQKRRQSKQRAEETVAEATRDAERLKKEIVERSRVESGRFKARMEREISLHRNRALAEIWNETARLSAEATEGLLRSLLNSDDHLRLVDEAIEEIGQLAEVA